MRDGNSWSAIPAELRHSGTPYQQKGKKDGQGRDCEACFGIHLKFSSVVWTHERIEARPDQDNRTMRRGHELQKLPVGLYRCAMG
jgi:hypothetical protein